eukprot:3810690-Alexandrium_andersonii.AAC.1
MPGAGWPLLPFQSGRADHERGFVQIGGADCVPGPRARPRALSRRQSVAESQVGGAPEPRRARE